MEAKKFTKSPSKRLKTGAGILAAARVVDTTPVKARLAAFTEAHRTYASSPLRKPLRAARSNSTL